MRQITSRPNNRNFLPSFSIFLLPESIYNCIFPNNQNSRIYQILARKKCCLSHNASKHCCLLTFYFSIHLSICTCRAKRNKYNFYSSMWRITNQCQTLQPQIILKCLLLLFKWSCNFELIRLVLLDLIAPYFLNPDIESKKER